jgi:hypothetical protein
MSAGLADTPDFTEARYRALLDIARDRFEFRPFRRHREPGRAVLWRHDVDMSPHRAAALARIEADAGVSATYYVWAQSPFYNLSEPAIARQIDVILGFGHEVGVHFDAQFHTERGSRENLEAALATERELLERMFGVQTDTFSLHEPVEGRWPELAGDEVLAYAPAIRDSYGYCSDSHGIWRYEPLADVLTRGDHERLQVLTHPEWWTPEAMHARERVTRCIEGRAAAQHVRYDRAIAKLRGAT